ncbi:hypothetical protein [Salinicoccus sesuvii]
MFSSLTTSESHTMAYGLYIVYLSNAKGFLTNEDIHSPLEYVSSCTELDAASALINHFQYAVDLALLPMNSIDNFLS